MYREGPEGTPFHTLLVEGYVDGPLDVCKLSQNAQKLYSFIHCGVFIDQVSIYNRSMYFMGVLPLQQMVSGEYS